MTDKEFSVKGWNYGAAKFEGAVLSFEVSNLPSFEIPLHNVSGSTTGKSEVTLEFHQVSYSQRKNKWLAFSSDMIFFIISIVAKLA